MRFLLDENLPRGIAILLREQGHDVLVVSDSLFRGVTDEVLYGLCAREKRILVSRDLDFSLPVSLEKPAGVVLIRAPDSFISSALVHLVEQFLFQYDVETLQGHITVISPGRIRSRRLY